MPPTFHELVSTRFGTATPNPGLGGERATSVEIGWQGHPRAGVNLSGAIFYSDVVLWDGTTQYQNVGNEFLGLEPGLNAAGDRWSDINTNTAPAFPYVETGGHALLNLDAYELPLNVEVAIGLQNLADQHYELAWGYPQSGRTFYTKARVGFCS